MNVFERILKVCGKNLAYTICFIVAIIFFGYFSDGLIQGIMTAASALIACTCAVMLYKEIKKEFSQKKPVAKGSSTKKTETKKSSSRKKNSK